MILTYISSFFIRMFTCPPRLQEVLMITFDEAYMDLLETDEINLSDEFRLSLRHTVLIALDDRVREMLEERDEALQGGGDDDEEAFRKTLRREMSELIRRFAHAGILHRF